MIDISVVIPVYNTEKYIVECVESVLANTQAEYEILCINDGSTDSSLQLLNNRQNKNAAFHAERQQSNEYFVGGHDMAIIQKGSKVRLSGDSADLWIADYNVRVDSLATVEEDPKKGAKKLLVTIDSIDGDQNVLAYVRRSRAIPAEED